MIGRGQQHVRSGAELRGDGEVVPTHAELAEEPSERAGLGALGRNVGEGVQADIGVSDVFPSTCMALPNGLPSNVHDFSGPVQTMTFVTPHASTQESISAEAWSHVNRLYLYLSGPKAQRRFRASPVRFFERVKQACILFDGLIEVIRTGGDIKAHPETAPPGVQDLPSFAGPHALNCGLRLALNAAIPSL